MKIGGYTAEEQIPDNLDVYIRLNGVLSSKQKHLFKQYNSES